MAKLQNDEYYFQSVLFKLDYLTRSCTGKYTVRSDSKLILLTKKRLLW